jgi:hypothetical protein
MLSLPAISKKFGRGLSLRQEANVRRAWLRHRGSKGMQLECRPDDIRHGTCNMYKGKEKREK